MSPSVCGSRRGLACFQFLQTPTRSKNLSLRLIDLAESLRLGEKIPPPTSEGLSIDLQPPRCDPKLRPRRLLWLSDRQAGAEEEVPPPPFPLAFCLFFFGILWDASGGDADLTFNRERNVAV